MREGRIGAGQERDDGVRRRRRRRRRELLDVFHAVVLEVVVADLHRLRAPGHRSVRVLRVGHIVCRRRGDGRVLDVLWPRERCVQEGGVVGGAWRRARGNKAIAGHVGRWRRVEGADVGEDARESCEGFVVVGAGEWA